MLDRTFDGGSEFDHMFMSAGEALEQLLGFFQGTETAGSTIILNTPEQDILKQTQELPLAALPLLSDAVDVCLLMLRQYGTVPRLADPALYAGFDIEAAAIFREMNLLDHQQVADRSFWPCLVNRHCLLPSAQGWNASLRDALRHLCDQTLATAPTDFKALVERRSDRPLTSAEGILTQRWRYGHWLTPQQQARSLAVGHQLLPIIVYKTLTDDTGDIHVPAQFLKNT